MDTPQFHPPQAVAPDTTLLGATIPVPGLGVLPINAFLLRAAQPVLLDTGLAGMSQPFLDALWNQLDPKDLRWVVLTHVDADHVGNLAAVLQAAPNARVVTNYLGMGKLGLLGLPQDRVYLLNPGQSLDVGDRTLTAFRPPSYDAPETMGFAESRNQVLFSSDCFGAVLQAPTDDAAAIDAAQLQEGLLTWATVDAPWLHSVDTGAFTYRLALLESFDPSVVLSSHLPPARGMTQQLLHMLDSARGAKPFEGPDQAALEAMMTAA